MQKAEGSAGLHLAEPNQNPGQKCKQFSGAKPAKQGSILSYFSQDPHKKKKLTDDLNCPPPFCNNKPERCNHGSESFQDRESV